MCGRYVLYGPVSRHNKHFQVDDWPEFPERFNIAPSSAVPVIRLSPEGKRSVDLLRWGLIPHWAKDPTIGNKLNNARGESIAEKPFFRKAFERRRCIVPASGFYEWKAEGKTKQPYFIHLKSNEPLAMAGLWESWKTPDGNLVRSFCVITTGPNEVMQPIHDRMPVILKPEDWTRWLDPKVSGEHIYKLVSPYPTEEMEAWPVSRRVSNALNEGKDLVIEI